MPIVPMKKSSLMVERKKPKKSTRVAVKKLTATAKRRNALQRKLNAQLKNEEEIVKAIKQWNRSHKYGPSFRDLVEMTELSLGTVHGACRDLRDKRKIDYIDGVARTIRIK